MKTKALRLYGKNDLRLESFTLPEIGDDEILATVVTDSICLSSWKEANLGADHKKVPDNVAENPIIIGHEFCGDILQVGKKWQHKFKPGSRYVIQANLQLPDRPDCPGYSFPYVGGEATHVVIPNEVMEQDCLLPYQGESYFEGSLVEPLSCVIGAFNANYHLVPGTYQHKMGIKSSGKVLILGGTGPMGLLAIDYALHGPINPALLVITDRHQQKLDYAARLYPSEPQTQVHYLNTQQTDDQFERLLALTEGKGYDDIFVFVPSAELVTLASSLLAPDGCFNFFAGPQDKNFMASVNFYDIHYSFTHYVGTSGGNTDDMREAVKLIEEKKVNAGKVVSHILGLNDAAETTLNLPKIIGGKKLVYTGKNIPLTSLSELMSQPQDLPLLQELQTILHKTDGLWSKEAEDFVLAHAQEI
ncbi:zinc-binding dehydrogenase [Yersinia vastinensis]|uniref:zinc-binding dehydrogenase n=1 Tax=Yersinia vastinensis TaxID=2890318 RepID=UPI0011A98D0E|nr:zinc-binding dehydrogenase [Yersinia vastinensis]